MYVVALAESKEQILLAHEVSVEHETPRMHYASHFGQHASYYGAGGETYKIRFRDVLAMEEHKNFWDLGAYVRNLPMLLLYEERSNVGHVITDGWVTEMNYGGFMDIMYEGTLHISSIGIQCMSMPTYTLSNGDTSPIPEEAREILRNIVIYTKGYSSD